MKLINYFYTNTWDKAFDSDYNTSNTLIIVFGSSNRKKIEEPFIQLVSFFSEATIVGASTAGEIFQDELFDDSLVVMVLQFNTTKIKCISASFSSFSDSKAIGKSLATQLYTDDLKAMFVLSDGLNVNGSALTEGISDIVGNSVVVTGGLAGDGDRFEHTWIVIDGQLVEGYVSALGLYGEDVHIRHGSKGGWDRLGVERIVTRSKENILYALDNQPALEIYKRYLGEKASELPASGLLFPLEIKESLSTQESKVRTILAVNEEDQSITFAGDIPKGSYVTLMKANYDRLIDGASLAAEEIVLGAYQNEPIVSIAISCVGRRLVLKQRAEEELEATLDVLPKDIQQIGFYSYGEISPLSSGQCDLHNQTMTLTIIWESDAPVI